MKEPKFKIIFSSILKSVITEEKNKFLAKASLEELRSFIPDIDPRNIDLLPFSTDAYVANHVNLNGSVVDTKSAIETASLFRYKFVNIEHDRKIIVAVILNVGFSEFGSNKPLTEEEASKLNTPFNVTVGGVIWKKASGSLSDLIEESNDKTSPNYMKISSSYEMGYDDYAVAVLNKNDRSLANAKIITDPDEIAKIEDKLQVNGGDGKLDENTNLAILLKGDIIPLGIAFTTSPAAAVKGVAVKLEDIEPQDEIDDIEENNIKIEEKEEKISQSQKTDVRKNNVIMIKTIKDITDETLKTVSASTVVDFIQEELTKSSEAWVKEKNEKDAALKASSEKITNLEETHKTILKELETVKNNLKALEDEKAALAKMEKFNQRMAAFDEKYELTDADRKVIASQIKDASDEAFTAFEKTMEVLLASKNKELVAKQKEVAASTTVSEEVEKVIDQAVEGSTVVTPAVPSTTSTAPTNLREKFKKAFAEDQFVIQASL